ncbi:MAG: hypothetical protein FJY10_11740 [Bacteroidetes bacterium]|nr:hypothetical protein [Bacteroidota bacterium]
MLDQKKKVFIDSSKLITEALAMAGADVFVGYPITPANLIYHHASRRFPVFLAAPDEITTLQWMSGFSVTGHIPVTATSFPGYALMIEGINMAYMMELPMVIVLVQRLGPATGTATRGAQGDIAVLSGTISGGMMIPSFSISNTLDCWRLSAKAVEVAVKYRTPVVIFTSKEEVMTMFNLNLNDLPPVTRVEQRIYDSSETYIPYQAGENKVSPFLPVTSTQHQVRFTASTHDKYGIIQNTSKEAMDNSRRIHEKVVDNVSDFTCYELDEQPGANILLASFGITSQAAREAVASLRASGHLISLLIMKTLFPVPPDYFPIFSRYQKLFIAEENLTGQYRQILFGCKPSDHVTGINEFGKMISPDSIIKKVLAHE